MSTQTDADDGTDEVQTTDSPDLDDIYAEFDAYTRMAARGEQAGLIVRSRPGIGKSHRAEEILEEERDERDQGATEYTFKSSYSSPLALYDTLYKASNEGHTLVIDDVTGITSDKRSAALLKAALEGQGSTEQRYVEWQSASDSLEKRDLPQSFQFQGTIIFLFNEIPSGSAHWDAVVSRCLVRNFTVSHHNRMKIIREVAKADYEGLTYRERMDTAEWIIDRATRSMDSIDLRTLMQAFQFRTSSVVQNLPDRDWTDMLLDQLFSDRRRRMAHESIGATPNLFEAQITYRQNITASDLVDHEIEDNWFLQQFDPETQARFIRDLEASCLDGEVPDDDARTVGAKWYGAIENVGDAVEYWTDVSGMSRKTYFNRKDNHPQ